MATLIRRRDRDAAVAQQDPSAELPGQSSGTYLAMGAAATVPFFGSSLFHDLSHTPRSLRVGVRVQEIALWPVGVSKAEGRLPSAGC